MIINDDIIVYHLTCDANANFNGPLKTDYLISLECERKEFVHSNMHVVDA